MIAEGFLVPYVFPYLVVPVVLGVLLWLVISTRRIRRSRGEPLAGSQPASDRR